MTARTSENVEKLRVFINTDLDQNISMLRISFTAGANEPSVQCALKKYLRFKPYLSWKMQELKKITKWDGWKLAISWLINKLPESNQIPAGPL